MGFVIGIENPKHHVNVASLIRSAYIYGAEGVFVIGERRYRPHAADTCKAHKHLPVWHFATARDLVDAFSEWTIYAVTLGLDGTVLPVVSHDEHAVYVLGNESSGVSLAVEWLANKSILIPTPADIPLNVSVAGVLVMHDRYIKQQAADYWRAA